MTFIAGLAFILIYIPHLFEQDAVEERILQYLVGRDPCINAYEYMTGKGTIAVI